MKIPDSVPIAELLSGSRHITKLTQLRRSFRPPVPAAPADFTSQDTAAPPAPGIYNAPAPAPKRVGRGMLAADIVLAAVLVIESAVAGFMYPGFFVEKRPLHDDISVTSEPSVSTAANVVTDRPPVRNDTDTSGTARATGSGMDYNIGITESDVNNAARYEAAVSPESPVCTAGRITADFKEWNLDGADRLETRELGTFTDEERGAALEVYDFSLESGQNTLLASVDITLPRPQDGSGDGVVYYDPETGSWKPAAFGISADGSSYILHTKHFSRFAVVKKYWSYLTSKLENAVGVFYVENVDPDTQTGFDIIRQPLRLSSEAVAAALQESIKPEDLVGVTKSYSFIDEKASIGFAVDELVGELLGVEGMSESADTSYGIGDLSTTVVSLFDKEKVKTLSESFGDIGDALLATRLGYAILKGESGSNILKEYSMDLITAGISKSMEALSVSNPISASVVILMTATSYFYGDDFKSWLSDQMDDSVYSEPTQRAYHEFLRTQMYYTDEYGMKCPLTLDGIGRKNYLRLDLEGVEASERLQKITQCIDDYLWLFWERDDIRVAYLDNFNKRLKEYYRLRESGSGQNVIRKDYASYQVTDYEKEQMITETKKRFFRNNKKLIEAFYEDLLNDLTAETINVIYRDMLPYLNTPMVFEVTDTSLKGDTFEKSIYAKKILESADGFSSAMTIGSAPAADILSIDPSVSPDTGISGDSVTLDNGNFMTDTDRLNLNLKTGLYRVGSFDQTAESIIVPPDIRVTGFYPRVYSGSNTVLECRLYYYLKFGRPKTMSLMGDSDTGAEPLSAVPITFTKSSSGITGTVVINGKTDSSGYVAKLDSDRKIQGVDDALRVACEHMVINGLDKGSFTASGSASVVSGITSGRSYTASATISGTLDKKTGRYNVRLEGTVFENYTNNETWTEEYGDWSSTHTANVSSNLKYEIVGTGDTSYVNGDEQFNVTFEVQEHETGYINSVETFTNNYGNSATTDTSGPVDLHRQYLFSVHFVKKE